MTYFHEDQRFRQSWLWVLIAVLLVLPVAVVIAVTPRASAVSLLAAVLVGAAVAALLALARLETTVTGDAVTIAFHGVWPTRRIRVADIAEVERTRYTMLDSGGWGVHLGLAGMTYNVSGNEGVRFRLKSGARVLLGTQRPDELLAAVHRAMAPAG
jgi:hypothetical protein